MTNNSKRSNREPDQGSKKNLREDKNNEQGAKFEERLTKQIAKGGGVYFFGLFGGKLLKFLFQILLTRVLGARAYGLYSLGNNALGISKTFSQLGLQSGVVRFGSIYQGEDDKARLKGTILTSLLFSFLAGLIVAVGLFVFADFLSKVIFNEPKLEWIIKIFSLSLPFYTLMIVSAHATRISRRMQYDVGVRLVLHPLVLITFSGLSFLLGFRLEGVIYGFLLSSIISAAFSIYLLAKLFPDLITGLSPQFEVKKLLSFSLTVLLTGFSYILIFRIDRIMLGIIGKAEEVGVYNAAVIMAAQVSVFMGSFNAIFAPIISDLFNRNKMQQLHNLFKTTTKWIFSLTLPIFLIFSLYSKQIMGIFGSEFTGGWVVLISLGLAQFINAAVGSAGYILRMTGYQKLELVNNLTLGGLNIVLNLLLIPKLGILGAAVATGISLALVNLARLVEVYWFHAIHPYKLAYWKPGLAGLVASCLVVAIRTAFVSLARLWVLGALVFALLYVVIYILTGFDSEDKLIVRAIIGKLKSEK